MKDVSISRSICDAVQVSSETDREDLRQVVEKLKNDGIDMKLEIQGLRNIEKVMKVLTEFHDCSLEINQQLCHVYWLWTEGEEALFRQKLHLQ